MKIVKKISALALAIALCAGLVACKGKNDMEDNPPVENTNTNSNREKENVIFSPYSLDMCLALVMNGADGDSLAQLEKYVGKSREKFNKDAEKQMKFYNELSSEFLNNKGHSNENNPPAVLVANSIWGNSNLFEFDKTYIKNVENSFDAKAGSLDFNSSEAAEMINDWCDKKTYGLIPSIVKPNELKASASVLTNSLYFKAGWSEPYKNVIKKEEFTNGDGTKSKVDMLSSTENLYLENDDITGFIKSYDGRGLYFVGVLPKKEGDFKFDDIDFNAVVAAIKESIKSDKNYKVVCKLPKFEIETEDSLLDMLKERGIIDIFDSGKANLSKLGKGVDNNPVYISKIKQKAKISLDENGTEAAAVTAAIAKLGSLPPQDIERKKVILNRPFAFMIYDTENEVILFEGKISKFD